MPVKSKVVISAAAVLLCGGVSAARTIPANADTPGCGASFSALFSELRPGQVEVLDVLNQVAEAGQPVGRAAASANPGEDFEISYQGTVDDFYMAGLMAAGLDALYGSLCVYQVQYTPGGTLTGLCVGVQPAPGLATPVTLQPCGVSAKTTWIFDPATSGTSSGIAVFNGAANSDFQHPSSLTALPLGQLFTSPLLVLKNSSVTKYQLWGAV
jgi:hypothetical protein